MWYKWGMLVRGVQFSPTLGNVERNLGHHRRQIAAAVKDRIDLIVFPELSLCGYQLRDIVHDVAFKRDSPELKEIASLSRKIDIVVGAPIEEPDGLIANAALYYSAGRLVHLHRKVQLPNYGMFEEKMIFKAGDRFQSFTARGRRIGLLICREILFPIHAYLYFLQHTDLLIAISNSPHRGITASGFASHALWETMGIVYSQNFHQDYVFVNRVGFEDGIGFAGGSFFAAAGQGIVSQARYAEAETIDHEFKAGDVRRARISSNYLRDEHPQLIMNELKRICDAGN